MNKKSTKQKIVINNKNISKTIKDAIKALKKLEKYEQRIN